MKVAVCLCGQQRTYQFCAPSQRRHIIDPYNADVFLCTDGNRQEMQETYNPVAMEIISAEEQRNKIGERIHRYGESVPNPGPYKEYPIFPAGDLMYLFKMWRCREMMRDYEAKHGEYDIVIATRFDAKFLNIQPIVKPEKNTFYIPLLDAFGKRAENGIHWGMGYSTHIWWADAVTASTILDAYHWSDEAYKETHQWCGESMTKHFCEKMHYDVKYIDVTFMLIRGTSDRPMEGLPPWHQLSETCFPEYLPQEWEKEMVKYPPRKEPSHAEGFSW